jgi:hypothetical protein
MDALLQALTHDQTPPQLSRHSCASMPQPQSSPEQARLAEAGIERDTKTNTIINRKPSFFANI